MTKYYAIKKGMDPKTGEELTNGMFTDWPTAQLHVKGVKGAIYKSFKTKEEALKYLHVEDSLMHKRDGLYDKEALHLYVDGSVNEDIPNYSYGLVCVKEGGVLHLEGGPGNNPEAITMRQIGGELLGAIKGLVYARKHQYRNAVIFHDYEGICYHATGDWKRSNAFSEAYYQWMQKFFRENPEIKVTFCKVDAHTGDDFNELADGLAKQAVDLLPDAIFYKVVEKYGIKL